MTLLKNLIDLAGKATPGPWKLWKQTDAVFVGIEAHVPKSILYGNVPVCGLIDDEDEGMDALANALYLCAANPETIKTICESLEIAIGALEIEEKRCGKLFGHLGEALAKIKEKLG